MTYAAQNAIAVLRAVPTLVGGVDVRHLDESALQAELALVRSAQRALDALVVRIGLRISELAEMGHAAPVDEVLRGQGAVGNRIARRDAARTQLAGEVAAVGAALRTGTASGEHVDALARHTAKLTDEQRAGFGFDSLVQRADGLPPETFDRLVKREVERAQADHGLQDSIAKRKASEFRHWFDTGTGMGKFSGSLDPERYEALTDAIDRQMSTIAAATAVAVDPADGKAINATTSKNHNLAAEALCDLVLSPVAGHGRRARLPSVTVIVDAETVLSGPHDGSIRQTAAGHGVPPEAIARLSCDATIRKVVLDAQAVPINVGRSYRTATDAQWAALKAIHATCAWQGCTAPINWCQAHHIHEWEHGGPTDLDNLVPLCSRHHHRVHEGRWRIKLLPDRSLEIFKPDQTHFATVPTPQRC